MNNNVFINCPFDEAYRDCFEAILFTVTIAGYSAHCALEEGDSGDIRFDKLCRLILKSDLTIHDLSRTELGRTGLPRFNMPLELGLTLGAKRFGPEPQTAKRLLIMVAKPFEMPQYLSDLGGNDPQSHASKPDEVVRIVRDYLHETPDGEMLPGPSHLQALFATFRRNLPSMAKRSLLRASEAHPFGSYRNYMGLLRPFVEGIRNMPGRQPPSRKRRSNMRGRRSS